MDEYKKLSELQDKLRKSIIYYESEIKKEQERIDGLTEFSWKRFSLFMFCIFTPPAMIYLNHHIFPSTSIFSWYYYIHE